MGWLLSRGRADRRSAKNRNTWFPVSAQECAASAVIEADPVRSAATVFAAATRKFAANAMITVSRVEPGFFFFSDCAIGLPYPTGGLLQAPGAQTLPNVGGPSSSVGIGRS